MATSNHVAHLEKLRSRLRRERRAVAEAVATGSAVDRRDLVEFGQLQRSLDAIDPAIEDENAEAAKEAERIRLANQPKPTSHVPFESLDHDDGPQ